MECPSCHLVFCYICATPKSGSIHSITDKSCHCSVFCNDSCPCIFLTSSDIAASSTSSTATVVINDNSDNDDDDEDDSFNISPPWLHRRAF